jgi:hypothetical protein
VSVAVAGDAKFYRVVSVLDRKPTKGVPEVDVCGLAKIRNSKERHVAHNLDRFGPRGA